MSTLAFLVRGRSVDLVAMTAFNTLRDTLGLGDEIVGLLRDDLFAIEGVDAGADWVAACQAQQHWFNPNKHRYAAFRAADGAVASIRTDGAWPEPWLEALISTDRPDLEGTGGGEHPRRAWIGVRAYEGAFAVPVVSWDREDGVGPLPGGHWPDATATRIRGVLWTLILRAEDADSAAARAAELVATRARRQGLLVHPHMQGWTAWGDPLTTLETVS